MDNSVRGLHALGSLSSIHPENRGSAVPLPTTYLQHPMSAPSRHTPPPLPPRQSAAYPSRVNRLSTMGSYYSPYSRYPSMGYSPYYSSRMSPYGHYGAPYGASDSYNSFIQMAEESTRPAFESIESVVEVVGSISMMLESTYMAVHSSYSAIIGVVDQFSRLKDHLAEILSILALLRGLRWLCFKVLYLLGLKKDNPSVEAAWNSAERLANNSEIPKEAKSSAWPFLMFIGLVIGAPWLMFKLLSKSVAKKPFDQSMFLDEQGRAYVATAAYDFNSAKHGELSFRAGEKLYIAPKSPRNKGWVYACNDRKETGLIPSNYLIVKRSSNARNSEVIAVKAVPMPAQELNRTPQETHAQISREASPVQGQELDAVAGPSIIQSTTTTHTAPPDFTSRKDSEMESPTDSEAETNADAEPVAVTIANPVAPVDDESSASALQECIDQTAELSDDTNIVDK